MPRISIVVPVVADGELASAVIERTRSQLASVGHEVEVILAYGPEVKDFGPCAPGWGTCRVESKGRVAAIVGGLRAAAGDWLVVWNPCQGYGPADVSRLVETLFASGGAVVVASRWCQGGGRGRLRRALIRLGAGRLWRLLSGSTDPMSGLMGLTRQAFEQVNPAVREIGSHFAVELLTLVPGPCVDEPAPGAVGFLQRLVMPGWSELRQIKRLADLRFGNLSRLLQFCIVGASGMVVDLITYAGLQWVLAATWLHGRGLPIVGPLDLAAAAVLAVLLALTWNFTWNRRLTFSDARTGSIPRQFVTYAVSNALAVSISLIVRLGLPRHFDFFHAHKLAAAVIGIVLATGISFSMARWLVFRKPVPRSDDPQTQADESLPTPQAAGSLF